MELEVVLSDESPDMPVDTLVDLARAARGLGCTTAWLPDHVLPPGDYGPTSDRSKMKRSRASSIAELRTAARETSFQQHLSTPQIRVT